MHHCAEVMAVCYAYSGGKLGDTLSSCRATAVSACMHSCNSCLYGKGDSYTCYYGQLSRQCSFWLSASLYACAHVGTRSPQIFRGSKPRKTQATPQMSLILTFTFSQSVLCMTVREGRPYTRAFAPAPYPLGARRYLLPHVGRNKRLSLL